MGALADMLAAHGGEDGEDGKDMAGEEGDARAMGVASLKAMFEAAKAGDFDAAYEHLCAATGHADGYEPDGDEGAAPPAHAKPMLEIQIGHHKR